ncbi:Hypotetical protein [Gulosibacter molinativorax]|nr:Hypotetical protein [Gulosibacter molinativorax]
MLVIGDSHTAYFRKTRQLANLVPGLEDITPYVKVEHGATLTGVGRMNSTLALGENARKWIGNAKPKHLVFNLGQVDVELGLPFRHFVKQDGIPIETHIDGFIRSYMEFIQGLDFDPSRITVKGINLPVLVHDRTKAVQYITRIVTERFTESDEDEARRATILERITAEYSDDRERTWLAGEFNTRLADAARENGVGYFDINRHILDPSTGMVAAEHIPFGNDHHLVPSLKVHALHWQGLLPLIL